MHQRLDAPRFARAGTMLALACLLVPACKTKETSSPSALASAPSAKPTLAAPEAAVDRDDLELVEPIVLDNLSPTAFADDELDLPYYLAHFSTVANAVESSGPHRGFININVWRGSAAPHNARVMENVLSLAWFYTQKRDWNPYYAAPALRTRIEAALQYWTRSQGPDGQLTEYEPSVFGLAPTAFATKFFGEALILLRAGPPIGSGVLAEAEASLAKAVRVTLTAPALYTTGRSYSNQFGNVWGGGLALLSIRPDPELRALWEKRFRQSHDDFQSPAGFYYEGDGPDFEYTLNTHCHNVRQAWEWLRGTPQGKDLSEREAEWAEWLALNALPEPSGGFVVNAAIATRKPLTAFRHHDTPIAEFVPLLRAYAESVQELAHRRKQERSQLVANWPRVAPLAVGQFSAFTPYTFLHRRLREWRPNTAERDAARASLPVLSRDTFTMQRRDSRKDATFSFIRRPTYYATFASGERAAEQQRYGIGLVWSPRLGAVLMSQPGSDRAAWGTIGATKKPFEANTLSVEFSVQNSAVRALEAGNHELPGGALVGTYPLGPSGGKVVTFQHGKIDVSVRLPGKLEESLPLLVPVDGNISAGSKAVTLATPRGSFVVRFDKGVTAVVEPPTGQVLDKKLVVVRLQAQDKLSYSLTLE